MASDFKGRDSLLLEYLITKNVNTYRGIVTDWLVANECYSQVGLVPSQWTDLCGREGIIDRAFHSAHKADPSAVLWLAEFGIQNAQLWDLLYQEVRSMLGRGVPIHGVSAHLHTDLYYRRKGLEISGVPSHLFPFHSLKGRRLRNEIRRFKDLGLKFHLSELTVWPRTDDPGRIAAQGRVYGRYVKIAIEEGCDRISFWTVLDDYKRPDLSWHWQGKRDFPGLWVRKGDKATPKPYTEELLRMIP
jgi:endo-1,4-beta-xylanase